MRHNNSDNNLNDIKHKPSNLKVYASAIVFSLIVGFSFLGIKTSLSVATPLETLTYRFNFAFLAALLPCIFGFIKINIKGKEKSGLAMAAGFYLLFMILQTVGLKFSTSIESGIIFAMIPIVTKIIARIILNEKTSWGQNIFVCLSVAAVIMMFVLGATDITVNVVGLFILLLSSLSMALSNVLMRYVRNDFRPIEISFFITGGGCFIFNLATIVTGIKYGTLGEYFEPLTHMNFVIATLYLGIPSTLISALIVAFMLANMEAVKATMFGNLSTAISIVTGVLILHEQLLEYHVVCTILIVVSVIGVSMPPMRKRKF